MQRYQSQCQEKLRSRPDPRRILTPPLAVMLAGKRSTPQGKPAAVVTGPYPDSMNHSDALVELPPKAKKGLG